MDEYPVLRYYGIGINAYDRSQLQGCVRDTENMRDLLVPRGWQINRLLDRDATPQNMVEFWTEGVAATRPQDAVLLHYSGHGAQGRAGSDVDESDATAECIVAVNMQPVWDNTIADILRRVHRQARVYVMLDCCHSHTGTRLAAFGVQSAGDSYRKAKRIGLVDLDYIPRGTGLGHKAIIGSSVPVVEFAACRETQVTYDAQINGVIQGCYTRAFIDSVKALDDDMALRGEGFTVSQLQRSIARRLPSEEYDNEPQLLATMRQRRWKALAADWSR